MAEGAINIEPEGNESRVPINRENVVFKSGGGGAVESVNGKTGNVVLTTSDLRNTSDYQTRTDVVDAISVEELARQNADADLQGQITSLSNTKADKSTTYTKTETDGFLSAKQDKLTAGTNITIDDNNVISASGGGATYTAGNGIDITSDVISADTTVLATKTDLSGKQDSLTAGSNIQINNNTISATDTTYSAGTGLDLTGTTFSADTTVLATKTDLSGKQDTLTAGTNVTISNNTISATDTTYSNFTGTDGQTAGTAGLVPAPATTDSDKYLKSDGTWATVSGGGGSSYTEIEVAQQDLVSYGGSNLYVPPAGLNPGWYKIHGDFTTAQLSWTFSFSNSESAEQNNDFYEHTYWLFVQDNADMYGGYHRGAMVISDRSQTYKGNYGGSSYQGNNSSIWFGTIPVSSGSPYSGENTPKILTTANILSDVDSGAYDSYGVLSARATASIKYLVQGNPFGGLAQWTTIGTSSAYTKRAMQTTINISESNLQIPATTWTTLCDTVNTPIDGDYCPSIDIYGTAIVTTANGIKAAKIKVTTSGELQVYSPEAATDVAGSIVFAVDV